MPPSLEDLLLGFGRNEPASEEAIAAAEAAVGHRFPADYVRFLLFANGGEGSIGSSYLALYRCEELREMQEGYGVDEFLPGLLLIGTSRGREAFAFDTRVETTPVVMVPFMALEEEYLRPVGSSFDDFLCRLHAEKD